jgi:hypothetical protein
VRYAFMLVLSAAALASCGGAGDSGDAAASGDKSREAQERAQLQLQQCLRKQGIDLPQPGQGGTPQRPTQLDREKLRSAMDGPCKKYRQKASGDLTREDREEMRDRMVKFASCMRQHGVDLPDPGSGRQDFSFGPNDTKVQKATTACRKELPGGGNGPQVIGPGPG